MQTEQSVARHYTHGSLERTILDALAASGTHPDYLTAEDLTPVDEFHIGGRQATIDFAEELGVRPGMHLLDIGSGLGGASRYFAKEVHCHVTGIDLTEEYVSVAESLSRRAGLDEDVSYQQASALELPFSANTFDAAYMLHVGMNVAEKAALFAEVRRVLKPGGAFGVYDVMREGEGELMFPVPWAADPATSFLEDAETYRRLLAGVGFKIIKSRSRRDFGVAFFRQLRDRMGAGGPPPLGLHILMGESAPQKVANMVAMLETGTIAPIEVICQVG